MNPAGRGDLVLAGIEIAGTLAFAHSGLIAATRKRMDVVGVTAVSLFVVFGGVMRDVLCNEVPAIFRDHRPYAVCSFAGAWAFLAVASAAGAGWEALVTGIVVTAGLRIAALACGWRVPGWTGGSDGERSGD
ncbi:MAG: TRIC cation channel family protein [Burkholderiales bacterium]|nr:MAG: TRIC cation channel family protein [Burkholderiales bacterium]